MEGYVFKWINFIKGWKPRFLIIEKNNLYISKRKEDEKEGIDLKSARVVDEKKKKHFYIETGINKVIYFKTNTDNEKTLWLNCLCEAIETQSKRGVSLCIEDKKLDETNFDRVSMNGLTFNFSDQYKTYQSEINKGENETDLYGSCVKNILTMQNLLFEYSYSMEAMNLYILNKKKKENHPIRKVYDELNNIKYELKVMRVSLSIRNNYTHV
jgi:hypothetical protein